MDYAAAIVIGYILGSIPVALLVARRHGVDLYAVGDGNPGAWNALEHLGGRRAWPAFIGDAAKALLAGLAGHAIGSWSVAFAAVAAAMIGHAFPLFAGFRGGKAVMTFVGGGFALAPLPALAAFAIFVTVSFTVSLAWGARVGIFGFPAIQYALDGADRTLASGALMCLIGALFGLSRLRRRSGPSTPAEAAPPRA
jgi:glycerol-3-phosphate acyltransferase PlsY